MGVNIKIRLSECVFSGTFTDFCPNPGAAVQCSAGELSQSGGIGVPGLALVLLQNPLQLLRGNAVTEMRSLRKLAVWRVPLSDFTPAEGQFPEASLLAGPHLLEELQLRRLLQPARCLCGRVLVQPPEVGPARQCTGGRGVDCLEAPTLFSVGCLASLRECGFHGQHQGSEPPDATCVPSTTS